MHSEQLILPTISHPQTGPLPSPEDFCSFAVYSYLFQGNSTRQIERLYGLDNKGFITQHVLEYFGINNPSENKGLYSGRELEEVTNLLLSQPQAAYVNLGKILQLQVQILQNNLQDFANFYRTTLQTIANDPQKLQHAEEEIANRLRFQQEYSLERLQNLSLQEYALGANEVSSHDSLCYKLEYGPYANTGMRIGGGSAGKWGIYRKKEDGKYYNYKNEVISDPEGAWREIRTELCELLQEYQNVTEPIATFKKYPALKGMGMALVKILYLCYPQKFLPLTKYNYIDWVLREFRCTYSRNTDTVALSFLINRYLRGNLPVLNEYDPNYLGEVLWDYCVLNNHDADVAATTPPPLAEYPKYSMADFLSEVFLDETEYLELKNLLKRKHNIILEGAPGVGKTFMAKRLAYSLMGEKANHRIKLVQFHQNYAYEDFIEGIKPGADGKFGLKDGSFKKFCQIAAQDPEHDYYLIIDEINRGNLSKILGELMVLIEHDKRDQKLELAYSGEEFSVPRNLYIIGMMNTADRSLALVDYALRRRFAFFFVPPAFDKTQFQDYLKLENKLPDTFVNQLCQKFIKLNHEITAILGKGFAIGHSYFVDSMRPHSYETDYNDIINYEIEPLLAEYWLDEPEKIKNLVKELRSGN